MNSIEKQIGKKIKEYDCIVIARHIGPDPDAVCSTIALRDLIKLNYPNKEVYAVGLTVSRFKFMGNLDKVEESKLKDALLIITDVPRFDRVDGASKEHFQYTIKIDHHPCDEKVCDLEYVDEAASSACQLIANIAFKNKLKLNREIASVLYTGIVADSERFLLSYTSEETLHIAAKLLGDYKLDLTTIYENLYNRDFNERKFEAYIINHLTITENGFGYIKINEDIIKEYHVDSATASNMVNGLNFIKELKVWTFSSFDEKNKLYKINIRSRGIVINDVAEQFNGGGHKFASGARIKEEEQVDALFQALDARCKEENEQKLS